jgi:site-specific recombinase XerD
MGVVYERSELPRDFEVNLNRFRKELLIKERASNTVKSYLSDLDLFFQYLIKHHPYIERIEQIRPVHVNDFEQASRLDRANSMRTVSRRLSSIRKFFDFMVQLEIIDKERHPAAKGKEAIKAKPPELRRNNVDFMNEDELFKFFRALFSRTDLKGGREKWMQKRDIAMFALFLGTGLRISELVSLNLAHYEQIVRENQITLIGKGKRERTVPVRESERNYLTDYVSVRPHCREKEALFLTKHYERMSVRGIQYVIKTYLRSAEIRMSITPHKLRHTYASLLVQKGVDMRRIQLLLGHKSITTTQIYAHLQNQDLHEAVKHHLPDWSQIVARNEPLPDEEK